MWASALCHREESSQGLLTWSPSHPRRLPSQALLDTPARMARLSEGRVFAIDSSMESITFQSSLVYGDPAAAAAAATAVAAVVIAKASAEDAILEGGHHKGAPRPPPIPSSMWNDSACHCRGGIPTSMARGAAPAAVPRACVSGLCWGAI